MLSGNLKKIRKSKKLSINELGRITGLSPSYLSALERGKKNNPSKEAVSNIANALGVLEERLTGESASSIIEKRIMELKMTIEEVAEKAEVPLFWLQNLDDFIPGQINKGFEDDFIEPHELNWDDARRRKGDPNNRVSFFAQKNSPPPSPVAGYQ